MPPKPGTYRPLNPPKPIAVDAQQERPVAVIDKAGERTDVASIEEFWVIDEEWWRDRIWRTYYRVRLEDGRIVTMFRDQVEGRWYEQGY